MVLQGHENKRAMILAAGLGTRLRPLTNNKPKALVEWQGRPLIDHVIACLSSYGFREIVINVHHFADQLIAYIESGNWEGVHITVSHEEDLLLDTGGGLKRAAPFLEKGPFLVYNVDILSSIDLDRLWHYHLQEGGLVTLAVKERSTSRSLLLDESGCLKGWRDNRNGDEILACSDSRGLRPIAYSAIQVMNPAIFELMPGEEVFPIMPLLLELAKNYRITTFRHDADDWADLGRLEAYS